MNNTKARVATYISNKIRYKRRTDLETRGSHIIILDIGTKSKTRIINLYRPFYPIDATERDFFTMQLNILNINVSTNTVILGDFNLDLNKMNDNSYGKKLNFNSFNNTLGHHRLEQMVHEEYNPTNNDK